MITFALFVALLWPRKPDDEGDVTKKPPRGSTPTSAIAPEAQAPDSAAAGQGAQPTSLIALAHDWGMDVGNNIVVDASGMGRLIGTDASVPVASSYPSHPITERFNVLTAYPLARSVTPATGAWPAAPASRES